MWLHAGHTLPVVAPSPHIRNNSPEIVALEIVSATGIVKHRGQEQPTNLTVWVSYQNLPDRIMFNLTLLNVGCHRVAYSVEQTPWVAKMQVRQEGKRNHNLDEWQKFCSMGVLSFLVPKAHGYAEAQVRDTAVSFIFVERVGFTYAEMLTWLSKEEPTTFSLSLVAVASTTVVSTLVKSSLAGLVAHDWHIGNVAFEDVDSVSLTVLKLIDWAGNRMATAPDSLSMRMNTAFQQFSKCLANFSSWGYTGEDATITQRWHGAMKLIQQALDTWWAPWATRTGGEPGDVLPKDVDVEG